MRRLIPLITVFLLTAPGLALAKERLSFDAVQGKVKVSQINTYETGYGKVVVLGVLESTTDDLLETPQIAVIIRDAQGEEIGRTGVQVSMLNPGSWMPFRAIFEKDEYPEWNSVDAEVWRAWAHPGDMAPSLEATVEREVADPEGISYVYQAKGKLANTDEVPLEFTAVGAAFYDADGNLVGVGHGSAATELPPGESATFEIGINTAGGEVARTEVTGFARPVER